ncbi:aspartate carbamoyltransferase regulatory subunit [Pantoea sp. Mhis]|uniref:aspartate carbamoyltransferase regulatory subunit n=1 Tax=Pantoea sp. Mhis TaxID=2576759 RepID=UPI00135861E4|nr:aspartate carbamoyltransferase regulatory subunit [Pantoea sp. Mhis]MXP56453.1 aspartate carbamoyltransferase regulatory subunit [Pantoea sp. Mhis]
MQVEAIKLGTVIDHIPAQMGFKLLSLFRLTETEQRITIGLNLPSIKIISKDLIKIENILLNDDQINQLVIYAPHVTVNRIEDYMVVAKIIPILPKYIERILICPNTNCISRNEPVLSNFAVKKHNNNIILKCKYCENEFMHRAVVI